MKFLKIALGLIFSMMCLSIQLSAKAEKDTYMSLEDLLFTEITVASLKVMTLRESPGIVTVITGEEIANSGARNLIDVLRLVPGFEFGGDVQSYISPSIRGIWASEGKVNLFLDGQEFNELLYSALQLSNPFPVDQIKKIEIIRGPGSALYGGYAELAVINIITKGASDLDGLAGSVTYGQMAKTFARRYVNLSYGKVFEKDISFSASFFGGDGNRSDQEYTDFQGNTYNMAKNSKLNPLNLNINWKYKGVDIRFMVDQFHMKQRDDMGVDILTPVSTDFDYYYFDLTYDYRIGEFITLTPRFKYKRQTPYKEPPAESGADNLVYNRTAERYTGNLMLSYDPTKRTNLIIGIEYYNDKAKDDLEGSYFSNGKKQVQYSNIAGYAQGLVNTPFINLTVGTRYDKHSSYGSSFAPRIGLTKVIDQFHFKLLASKAYRAPGIENIQLARSGIEPEETTVLEFETGYQISKNIFATANIFDLFLKKPIVYFYDPITEEEVYLNYDKVKTQGLECEIRLKESWGYANLNYSYYRAIENKVEKYKVPGRDDILLGFPAHKVTLNTSINLSKGLTLNPSTIYLSERYGYYTSDEAGNPVLKKFKPIVLANLYLRYGNAFMPNLDIGVGFYDIFNSRYEFIQPHNSEHSPLPGPSREIIFKVSYKY